jgi:hypothetical protein
MLCRGRRSVQSGGATNRSVVFCAFARLQRSARHLNPFLERRERPTQETRCLRLAEPERGYT